MKQERVSIVIRALNEEKWLGDAISSCKMQVIGDENVEIVLVDSGSTDRTLEIAEEAGCRIVKIKKSDFTFGRSLNYGCEAATGDYLVFISAHCVPAHEHRLGNLIEPLRKGKAEYVYGRQIGHEVTRFSEHQIFAQYFPSHDKCPQDDFFINNANSAIRKDQWTRYKFDENVTGLEDMVLGKAITEDGGKIAYIADAPVFHIHEETLEQTKRRYYREALTLREIMPEVQVHFSDFLRYYFAAIFHDISKAISQRKFLSVVGEIVAFRWMQYWGTYRGHNEHRKLSRVQKEQYYYPRAKSVAGDRDHAERNSATTSSKALVK